MKHLVGFGMVMLVIGVAIGWFLRGPMEPAGRVDNVPVPGGKSDAPGALASSEPPGPLTKRNVRPDHRSRTKEADEFMQSEQMTEYAAKMMESMADRQRDLLDQYFSKVDARVAFTDSQKAEIGTWLNRETERAKGFDLVTAANDGPGNSAVNVFSQGGLEALIDELLSGDQKEEFRTFREEQRAANADALALKNLSQLQKVVSFDGDQRDRVYQIFLEHANQRLAATDAGEDMTQFLHQGMGVEMDPYDLGLESLLSEAYSHDGPPEDQKDTSQVLRDAFAKRVEDKVELLRPVLDEAQLDQYRNELRNRGGGFIDQMIMGLEISNPGESRKVDGGEGVK